MNFVKRIVYLFILISVLACNADDFLDKKPEASITSGNFFTTHQHALDAVTAVYDVLQWEFDEAGGGGWHSHMLWMFGDICSDDADKGGQNDADVKVLLDLSNFEGNSSAVVLLAPWNISYTGIARANIAINSIEKMDISDDDFVKNKQRYIAECKFLRALFYFNLVKMYGGVVKTTEILAPSEYQATRSTETEIWNLIESDLKAAAAELPTKVTYTSDDLGRATSDAANAFLAKAYLFQQKWQEAKTLAEVVINGGDYSLVTDYETIFSTSGEHGSGSIFEVNYTNTIGGGWPPNSSEGTVLHTFFGIREGGQYTGWGWNLPTQNLYDAFETNDYRREATIAKAGDRINGVIFPKTSADKPYYSRKYILPSEDFPDASLGDVLYLGPTNLRLMRYADLLLIHAEASAKIGDESAALTSLNVVRLRARQFAVLKNPSLASDPTVLPDYASNGNQLINDIWHERRVELAMEGHRFFDLVRQGRAGQVMRAFGKTKFTDGVHEHFPIPLKEIQLTGGSLTQNPGW